MFIEKYNSEQEDDKKKEIEQTFFVYLLYSYISGNKGNFALHLASNPNIKIKPESHDDEKESDIYLNVPTYIKEGLEWLLK